MAIIRPCIDPALCCGDGLCVAVCPTGSIVMDSGKAVLNPGLSRPCNGCGHCAAVCPRRAVSVEREGQGDTPADDAAWSAWRLEPARLNAFLRMRRSVREFKPDPVPREVLEAVLALPPKQRAAVHLHYYEGYTTDEIAAILGQRPGTVRSHLSRARQALKEQLKGEK